MSGAKRRRPGAAESPEEARGRLIRKLFAHYDGHAPFRDALRQLADQHREAVAACAPRPVLTPDGGPVLEVSWDTGKPMSGRPVRSIPSWEMVRADLAAAVPGVPAYVAALERFAARWGLDQLGIVPLPEPAVGPPDWWPTDRPFPSAHRPYPDQPTERPGLEALHAWCLLYLANGGDAGTPFGLGHLVSSLAARVNTTVRLGDFIAQWDPEEAPLADQLLPVPEHLLAEIGHHPGLRLRTVRGQRGWYVPAEGARTRIRKAASEAKGARLTPQEQGLLDQQLARIEAEFAAAEHVHPDTAPEEDTHLRWVFQRLAPVGRGGRPLGVWQIALSEGADEKTIRNETDRLRKRLGVARFPSSPRKPEHGPRS